MEVPSKSFLPAMSAGALPYVDGLPKIQYRSNPFRMTSGEKSQRLWTTERRGAKKRIEITAEDNSSSTPKLIVTTTDRRKTNVMKKISAIAGEIL